MFSRHCYWVLRVAYTLWCGDGGLELLTYWSASRGAHDWLTNCLAGPTHTVKGTLVRLSVIFWKPHSDKRCSLHSTRNCDTGDPRMFALNCKLKRGGRSYIFSNLILIVPCITYRKFTTVATKSRHCILPWDTGNLLYATPYEQDRIMSCMNFNPPTCLNDKSPSSGGHQFKEIYNITTSVFWGPRWHRG